MSKKTHAIVRTVEGVGVIRGEGSLRKIRCPKCQCVASPSSGTADTVQCAGCGTKYSSKPM